VTDHVPKNKHCTKYFIKTPRVLQMQRLSEHRFLPRLTLPSCYQWFEISSLQDLSCVRTLTAGLSR
jgi:hypothetical protein